MIETVRSRVAQPEASYGGGCGGASGEVPIVPPRRGRAAIAGGHRRAAMPTWPSCRRRLSEGSMRRCPGWRRSRRRPGEARAEARLRCLRFLLRAGPVVGTKAAAPGARGDRAGSDLPAKARTARERQLRMDAMDARSRRAARRNSARRDPSPPRGSHTSPSRWGGSAAGMDTRGVSRYAGCVGKSRRLLQPALSRIGVAPGIHVGAREAGRSTGYATRFLRARDASARSSISI